MRRGHPGSHTFTSPGDSRRPPVSCRHAFDSGKRQSFSAEGLSTEGLPGAVGAATLSLPLRGCPPQLGPTQGND